MVKSNDRLTVQSELHTAGFWLRHQNHIKFWAMLQQQDIGLTHVTITVMSLSTGEHSATYINILLKLMQLDYCTAIHPFACVISLVNHTLPTAYRYTPPYTDTNPVYRCTPLYIDVHHCIPTHTTVCPCKPLYTNADHCTPMHTTVCPCTPLYTHAHHCKPMHTTVHPCTPLYTHAHHCTPMHSTVCP